MANHKSAIKRHLQSEKRRERNRMVKGTIRTQLKKARAAIESKSATSTTGDVLAAVKVLASAASKGVLHKRTAARRISRIMRAANRANA